MSDRVETAGEVRRHELYADVAEKIGRFLHEKHGIDLEKAVDAGIEAADFLADQWKGQNIYFASDREFRHSKRDLEIFERMRRGNANELAAEFGISYVRVHQVYKRMLQAARRRVQPDMFPDGDGQGPPALS